MTPKQERFVQEYLIDLNATQAAIRAGYSKKTANPQAARLLAKVSIKQAIDAALAKRTERTEITQEWVIEQLLAVGEQARGLGQTGAANRSYELVGKHVGMFVDRHSVDLKRENIERASEEQLVAFLAAFRSSNGAADEGEGAEELPPLH